MFTNNRNKIKFHDRPPETFASYLIETSEWYLVVDRRGPQWVSEFPIYLMRNSDVADMIHDLDANETEKYVCQVSAFSAEIVTAEGVIYIYRLDTTRLSDMNLGPDFLAYPKELPKEAEREVRMAIIHFN